MEQEWMTGGSAAADGLTVDGLGDVRRTSGTRVRVVAEGPIVLAVVGDCPVTEEELHPALVAVRAGQWGALSRWPGSYWVVVGNGRQRFVCGDLAGIRPVYYTLRGDEEMAWATEARLLGRPLVPDLPWLAAPLPHMAGVAVGGSLHLQLNAELGDEHEARGVVLRGDFAAAGAAGASGGHFTGGAVELFDGGGRFGELWHVAEPIARGFVRKVFCERL